MSIKRSCDLCYKEFSGRDDCVNAEMTTKNICGYDSGHSRYDICEDCGRKVNEFLEKMRDRNPKKEKNRGKKKNGSKERTIVCRYSPNEDKGRCI